MNLKSILKEKIEIYYNISFINFKILFYSFIFSYLKNNFKKKIILLLFISCKETASNYLL